MPNPRTLFFDSAKEAQDYATLYDFSRGRPVQFKLDKSKWMFERSIPGPEGGRVAGFLCNDDLFRHYIIVLPEEERFIALPTRTQS